MWLPHNKCILQLFKSLKLIISTSKVKDNNPITFDLCMNRLYNFRWELFSKFSQQIIHSLSLEERTRLLFLFLVRWFFFLCNKIWWMREKYFSNYSQNEISNWILISLRQGKTNSLEIICNLKHQPGSSFSENSQEYPFDGWYRE